VHYHRLLVYNRLLLVQSVQCLLNHKIVIVHEMEKTYNINCNNNKNNYLIKKFINKTGKKHPNNKCHQLIHQTGVSMPKEDK